MKIESTETQEKKFETLEESVVSVLSEARRQPVQQTAATAQPQQPAQQQAAPTKPADPANAAQAAWYVKLGCDFLRNDETWGQYFYQTCGQTRSLAEDILYRLGQVS